MKPHTRACYANHLSNHWLLDPTWMEATLTQARIHGLSSFAGGQVSHAAVDQAAASTVSGGRGEYDTVQGVAIVSIDGPMAKFDSSLGGTNTIRVRASLRAAVADESVGAIILRADSPGGTVDGTKELSDAVVAANAAKPVFGYAEDMAASAAYWVLAQARKVYANATALVGSIGVFTVLHDSSKAYELAGVKAILVGSGGMKGMGTDGLPITDEQIAYIQEIIADRARFFLQAVADGRKMSMADVKAMADGKVHVAAKAKQFGLIDGVKTFDEVLAEASSKVKPRGRDRLSALVDIEAAQ